VAKTAKVSRLFSGKNIQPLEKSAEVVIPQLPGEVVIPLLTKSGKVVVPTTLNSETLACWVVDENFSRDQERLKIPSDPTQWNKGHVEHWIQWAVKEFKLQNVNTDGFSRKSGRQLCATTRPQFLGLVPSDPGGIFWKHFELLRKSKFVATQRFIGARGVSKDLTSCLQDASKKPTSASVLTPHAKGVIHIINHALGSDMSSKDLQPPNQNSFSARGSESCSKKLQSPSQNEFIESVDEEEEEDDEWDMFVSSICCDLRKLKDPVFIMKVKAIITTAVNDTVIDQLSMARSNSHSRKIKSSPHKKKKSVVPIDEWDMFASSTTCDLRKLNDPVLIMKVKAIITAAVNDTVIEQLSIDQKAKENNR